MQLKYFDGTGHTGSFLTGRKKEANISFDFFAGMIEELIL